MAKASTWTVSSDLGIAGWRLSICHRRAISRCRRRTVGYVIAYNGEIYNYQELRIELEALGSHLPLADRYRGVAQRASPNGESRSSTGSMAWLRSRSGTPRSLTLTLARDRYGIKPLYYARIGQHAACSAPRSRRCSSIRRCESQNSTVSGLAEYLTFQNFFHRENSVQRRAYAAVLVSICKSARRVIAQACARASAILGLPL